MKRFALNSTVAAIALLSASSAFANDYNSGVVTKTPSDGYTDVEFGSGWYLRGDITYNVNGRSSASVTTVPAISGGNFVQTDYDDAVGARVGAGYYVSPNFRLEASVETLFNSEFDGVFQRSYGGSRVDAAGGIDFFDSNGQITGSTSPAFIGTFTTPINGTETVDASYTANNFILNAYYDLNSVGTITPYVGAGAGFSRIATEETRTFNCIPGAAVETCAFPPGGAGEATTTTRSRDDEYWAFAYQLSVGAAIAIDERMKLDIGYSYTNVDDGDEISYSDGTAVSDEGFELHQVRAGIRYDIW